MSKKKLAGIIAGCVIAIIVVIVIVKHLPMDTEQPQRTAVSAYDFANQLFDPELTSLQRDELWEDHEGKQVKWTNELQDVAIEKGEPVAYFLNPSDWGPTEIKAVFDESQRSSLLELKESDLVTYTGVLATFGKDEISLTDCTVVSLAIVPLWWNNDIDTYSKRILVGDEVLCLGASTEADLLESMFHYNYGITTIDRETGELLWKLENTYCTLIGIDFSYIYIYDWLSGHNIAALEKLSGQIGWTSPLSGNCSCPQCTLNPEASLSDCVDYWVSQIRGAGNRTKNNGEPAPILLVSRPTLPELAYEHEGVIYGSGSGSYGIRLGEGRYVLQAIDQRTSGVLWIATSEYMGMTDFAVADGILYVSTDNGIGAFELPNVTDLLNLNSSEIAISISRRGYALWIGRWCSLLSPGLHNFTPHFSFKKKIY